MEANGNFGLRRNPWKLHRCVGGRVCVWVCVGGREINETDRVKCPNCQERDDILQEKKITSPANRKDQWGWNLSAHSGCRTMLQAPKYKHSLIQAYIIYIISKYKILPMQKCPSYKGTPQGVLHWGTAPLSSIHVVRAITSHPNYTRIFFTFNRDMC